MISYGIPNHFHNGGKLNTEYNAPSIEFNSDATVTPAVTTSATAAATPTPAVVEEKKKGLSMPMMALILLLVLALLFFLFNQNTFGGRGGFIRNAFSMFGKP
jgi:hypothetical protein